MIVVPGASDAAIIRFSVPVCDGVSKVKVRATQAIAGGDAG